MDYCLPMNLIGSSSLSVILLFFCAGGVGLPGKEGPSGKKGNQGVKGERGERGEQGPSGEKGDTGSLEVRNICYASTEPPSLPIFLNPFLIRSLSPSFPPCHPTYLDIDKGKAALGPCCQNLSMNL